jgi:DNA modification methylase
LKATIYIGDVLDRLREMPDESVQCVVTSPPYWNLRDYGIGGQIGLEANPAKFLAKIVDIFGEVRRVLRSDGTCWINMGDSYNSGASGGLGGSTITGGQSNQQKSNRHGKQLVANLKQKDLIGIPWRMAFALQNDGWWLRQDIIWSKPNPMPESVTDRCTKAHEYLFLLTKSARYYFDQDAIRTPYATETKAQSFETMDFSLRDGYRSPTRVAGWAAGASSHNSVDHAKAKSHKGSKFDQGKTAATKPTVQRGNRIDNIKGANKRSVWEIASEPFAEAHFATYPTKLVEPCILAGTKIGDVVLDPFCGSGTTGLVAMRYQRNFVGIELNPEYARMAERRIGDEIPLFTGVEVIGLKPQAVVNG